MQWKCWIGAAEDGGKVVAERSDGTLCSIAAMYMRWCKLKVNLLLVHIIFQCFGGFIVEALQLWLKAFFAEELVDLLVYKNNAGATFIFIGSTRMALLSSS
jgi:hypothetical protein